MPLFVSIYCNKYHYKPSSISLERSKEGEAPLNSDVLLGLLPSFTFSKLYSITLLGWCYAFFNFYQLFLSIFISNFAFILFIRSERSSLVSILSNTISFCLFYCLWMMNLTLAFSSCLLSVITLSRLNILYIQCFTSIWIGLHTPDLSAHSASPSNSPCETCWQAFQRLSWPS